jgi:hypothetical protein
MSEIRSLKHKTNHARKHPTPEEKRQESALARKLARSLRGDKEQIARLDAAFGVGMGAKRERERLSKSVK